MDNTFDINQNPQSPTPLPQDPLNTGNGSTPSNGIAPQPAPQPSTEPHEIKLETLAAPAEIQSAPQQMPPVVEPTPPMPPVTDPQPADPQAPETNESKVKLYIIIAVVAILVMTIGYFGYSYFSSDSSEEEPTETTEENETPNNLTNKLSETDEGETSKEMEELDDVVGNLKDIYADQAEAKETSSPPQLIIDLSESETEETADSSETPEKIAR